MSLSDAHYTCYGGKYLKDHYISIANIQKTFVRQLSRVSDLDHIITISYTRSPSAEYQTLSK